VAGTHGKTSTSALVAHLLHQGGVACNAFLGGIASDFNSNVLIAPESNIVVVEADEYDRSFLKLAPNIAVVTSVEADHLDIYGSASALEATFQEFASLLPESGKLFCRKGINLHTEAELYSYGVDPEADIAAIDVEVHDGYFSFEAIDFGESMGRMSMAFPGRHNVENALAAIGIALHFGLDKEQIAAGLKSFHGVKRRFETHVRRPDCVYIDDYAHHPTELRACIGAARELYPERRITGIFQPHLYSRTRDFGDEFARSLEALNDLLLMEIYPAREAPIPGIDGQWLLNKIQLVNKKLCSKDELVDEVLRLAPEVLLTMGAGDIDAFVEPLKKALDHE
jgi:UDP-N-acetylmuramate--alanine ligase